MTSIESLFALGECLEVGFSRSTAGRVLAEVERDVPGRWDEVWAQRWELLAPRLGFQGVIARGDLEQVLEPIRPGVVALFPSHQPSEDWLIVTQADVGAVKILDRTHDAEPQWLGKSALDSRLSGRHSGLELACLLVERAMPCSPPASESLGQPELASTPHEHQHHHGPPPLRRLLQILSPDRGDIWLIISYAVGISILMLATPITIEALVTTVAFGAVLQPLIVLSLILLGCLMFAAVLRGMQTFYVEILQRRLFVRVTTDLAQRLPRVSISEYDQNHGPELVNRFFDVLTVQKISATLLMDGVMVVLQASIGMLVVAFYHPLLLALDLVLVGLLFFIVFGLGRGAVKTTIQESISKYRVAEWLQELARNPVTFKMAGGAEYANQRAADLTAEYLANRDTAFRILMRQIIALLVLQALAGTALLGVGGWLVIGGSLTLGQLVAAEFILSAVISSFVKFGKHLESYYDLLAATDKLGHLIDLQLEASGTENLARQTQPAALEVRHLGFSYHAHQPVFENLSFTLQPGERVAIQTRQGQGSTTLAELLYGLRQPQAGQILFASCCYRDLHLETLRNQVALVGRTEIFDGTITDNLRMGQHDLTDQAIRATLQQVGLGEELQHLPSGLNTMLTTGGSPLSGSQLQRLMLARAILKKPRLLIIDEALDRFNASQEPELRECLFDSQAPWTLLLMTQQQDWLECCGRVIDLRQLASAHKPAGLLALPNGGVATHA